MANAFKCDVCGEYTDGSPMMITIIPPDMKQHTKQYDVCPFCANEIVEVLTREKVFGDLDNADK